MRKSANTIGGKALANQISSFIKSNNDDMKKSSPDRSSEQNITIGIEDMANAIAYGIEMALKNQEYDLKSVSGTWGTSVGPATSPVTVLKGLKFQ